MFGLLRKKSNLNTKVNTAMKTEIKIMQNATSLKIGIELSRAYFIRKIILINTFTNEIKEYPVSTLDEKFVFSYSQENLVNDLNSVRDSLVEEIDKLTENLNGRTGLWHWYIEVVVNIDEISEVEINKIKERIHNEKDLDDPMKWMNSGSTYKKPLRLGKFLRTEIEGLKEIVINDHTILSYINNHGYLVTAIDEEIKGKVSLQIEKLKTSNSTIVISGRINTGYFELTNCKAILKSRTTTKEYSFVLNLERNEELNRNRYGRNISLFEIEINFENLLGYNQDTYDLYIEGNLPYSQLPIRIRVGRPTTRAKYLYGELSGKSESGMLLINPYYTIFQSNLSFEIFPFVEENYKYLKKARKFTKIKQLLNRKKDVWLVGERPYKAQDTGYHFFKYMREKHPEKNVYYVISKDSPEYQNVAPLGNILEYGSKEHIKNTIIATKIFSSHHADYLFPLRTKSFNNSIRATRIFLQHGVFGVKNMSRTYGKQSLTFKTDMFVTSSEYEKEYAVRDLNYQEKDVFVTGLSRFDTLFEKDIMLKRQVLIIPTWRDWLQDIDSFLDSEYYARYISLVNNEELLQDANDNKYELVLCLHPNMQIFSSYFSGTPVKIIYQGDIDVQELIKESALLVTDYSSVALDFSFLHKPVVYYQFDQSRFIGKAGSHINLEKDLPGEIFNDEFELVEKIKFYTNNDFKMEEVYKERANRFVAYRDLNSSERIYEAAIRYKKNKSFSEKLQEKEIIKDIFKKFRKSKYYFPVMKRLFSIMKKVLPINKKKVFLESGLGKNFSDSPKEIFEVLQKENRDLEYVWSYNQKLKKKYKNTKVVKRLSPSYYYHLATAGYWVNNQNFPTYIKKRKKTTFLQAWHGTPLKRMLHDVEEIQGRDETYLARVSEAVKNWDYLISPSKYASNAFKSAFKYSGPILEVGYPRNDIFYKENSEYKIQELRNRFNIDSSKKVILYAMTFRDNQTKGGKFTMNLELDLQRFHERFGDEYVLLIRMHVVISKKLKIPEEYEESIINVSSYPDIQELMLLSDILITDYSSVFFDYLNTNNPILFYTYDLEEYRDILRGFYLDFEKDAPGPLCLDESALFEAITNIDQVKKEYQLKYQEAKERFCYLDDGQAAKRVVSNVFK